MSCLDWNNVETPALCFHVDEIKMAAGFVSAVKTSLNVWIDLLPVSLQVVTPASATPRPNVWTLWVSRCSPRCWTWPETEPGSCRGPARPASPSSRWTSRSLSRCSRRCWTPGPSWASEVHLYQKHVENKLKQKRKLQAGFPAKMADFLLVFRAKLQRLFFLFWGVLPTCRISALYDV